MSLDAPLQHVMSGPFASGGGSFNGGLSIAMSAMDNEAATSENVITRHLYKARAALASLSGAAAAAAAANNAAAGLFIGADANDGRSSALSSVPDGGVSSSPAAIAAAAAAAKKQPYYVKVEGHDIDEAKGAEPIVVALRLRDEFYKAKDQDKGGLEDRVQPDELPDFEKYEVEVKHGVCTLPDGVLKSKPVPWRKYIEHLSEVFNVLETGTCLSFAKSRLLAMQEKFKLFSLLNEDLEEAFDSHSGGGGVFGRSVKVDNGVRLSTCVTADVLVENIRRAARHRADEVVHIDQHNRPITFRELTVDELEINASTVTAEGLGLHPPARKEPSKRYDVLDPDMNASGEFGVELLSLFLEPHGFNSGRFFADLVRPLLERRETDALQAVSSSMNSAANPQASLNIAAEYKLAIHGRRMDEWSVVARWICEHSFPQMTRAVFNIEIPRVEKTRDSFSEDCRTNEDQLKNIFMPMFMATLRPQDPELRDIAVALLKVGAICISSDEQVRRIDFHKEEEPPASKPWRSFVPDDYYFFYYVWANLWNLNALRRRLGLNTLQFRTICSEETPHWDQLAVSFLLADHVEQAGNRLATSWVLQYLYNISRIGVIMSPISSNGVGVSFFESAFPTLFARGLNMSLSTGDPLHYHHNPEPLVEEYGIAQSHFDLSTADMAELARNSVLISCFSHEFKLVALGPGYNQGLSGNDERKSHVSDVRLHFRRECLMQEQAALNLAVSQTSKAEKKPMINFFKTIESENDNKQQDRNGGGGGGADDGSATTAAAAARNPLLAKLREMQRINSIDRRYPLNRIVLEGPPPDMRTVRPLANSLRSAITLRNEYQLAAQCATVELDGCAPAETVNTNTNNNNPRTAAAAAVAAKERMMGSSFRFGPQSTGDDIAGIERAFRGGGSGDGGTAGFDPSQYSFGMYFGVCLFHAAGTSPEWPPYIPEFENFLNDIAAIRQMVVEDSALAEFCQQRLQLLEHRFELHLALNINKECGDVKDRELDNRDFYTAARVDNFLATEACMNARVLFHYFTERARVGQNDVVFERDKHPVTLRQYMSEIGIDDDIDRLTVDELTNLLARHQELRRLFLSPDNYMGGRYFAELTKATLEQYKEDKYSFAEMRLPIYGRSKDEWDVLASWAERYGMQSSQTRWVARISRSYRHLKREGHVSNFGEYLSHIFLPLWEVSLRPAKFPRLHHFLAYVTGFDCDGNEQKVDAALEHRPPHEWDSVLNPPFNYYMYYIWANIAVLNAFRRQRGLNVFSFRPQAGESGSLDHLIGAFLVADGISHGVTLRQSPTLQYLFYITQLPVAMCPLSNTNVIPYLEHPFSHFFKRGLNVSLATNKPLFNHFTSEPLIEEYSLAAKIWTLQNGDLAELARNSVRMSDFGAKWKRQKLGPLFDLNSVLGNDVVLSRVSDLRIAYRFETYHAELDYLDEVYALADLKGWIVTNFAAPASTSGGGGAHTPLIASSSNNVASPFGSGVLLNAVHRDGVRNSSFAIAAEALAEIALPSSSAGAGGGGGGGDAAEYGMRAPTPAGGLRRRLSNVSVDRGGAVSSLGQRAPSAQRLTTKQLIAQAHSVQREPFPRAMLSLEMEVEVHRSRVGGPALFIPSAAGGERAKQQAEEEELGRAQMATQLKQQVSELKRELAAKQVEITRMEEERLALASDIGDTRRSIQKMTAKPSTTVEAGLATAVGAGAGGASGSTKM